MEKTTCTKCEAQNNINSKYCANCGFELPKAQIEAGVVQKTIPKPAKRDKTRLGIFFGAVAFGLAYWGVQQLFSGSPAFDKQMMIVANELNKNCPLMIDAETRMDNSIALPGNVFQYHYTLLTTEKTMVDTLEFKNYMEPNIINQIKTNPQMKLFRDNKITMNYLYRDKNAEYISLISITPDKYK